MSRLEQIEHQIRELSAEELGALRARSFEYEAELWDHRFESDVDANEL